MFFKIKRTTQLKKLMEAYCERQGKSMAAVRFLYDGERIQAHHTPAEVCAFVDYQPVEMNGRIDGQGNGWIDGRDINYIANSSFDCVNIARNGGR